MSMLSDVENTDHAVHSDQCDYNANLQYIGTREDHERSRVQLMGHSDCLESRLGHCIIASALRALSTQYQADCLVT